jgi:hypothetical protein
LLYRIIRKCSSRWENPNNDQENVDTVEGKVIKLMGEESNKSKTLHITLHPSLKLRFYHWVVQGRKLRTRKLKKNYWIVTQEQSFTNIIGVCREGDHLCAGQ